MSLIFIFYRRVHISKSTLLHLNQEFEVERAFGDQRDDVLKERDIETFFIVSPQDGTKVASFILMDLRLISQWHPIICYTKQTDKLINCVSFQKGHFDIRLKGSL